MCLLAAMSPKGSNAYKVFIASPSIAYRGVYKRL